MRMRFEAFQRYKRSTIKPSLQTRGRVVVVEGRKAYTQRKKGKNKSPTNLQMSLF